MYYNYIIESVTSGKWYYGFTEEPIRRLDGHNRGLNKSTAGRGPWKYIFQRPFENKSDAQKFEAYLKKTKNKHYLTFRFGSESGGGLFVS